MQELNGKVFAITGATAGIGEALARRLAAAGASVALGGRREDRLQALVAELGDRAAAVVMDVRDVDGSRRLIDTALERFGRLDGVVANAGIGVYGGILDPTDDQVRDMIDVNVTGTVWPIRAAVPHLRAAGGGDIIIVSSVAGLRGEGFEAVYAATKFAQVGLAGGLDRELRADNIRVTSINPGGVATEFAMGTGREPGMPGLDDMLRADDVAAAIVTVLQQPAHMRSLVWSMRHMHEAD